LLVGRHPECDIRFDLPTISRRHCCLALAYDRITIRDLGSRHGIRVNGELCEESRLHPGDELAIGPLLFRFEGDTPAPPPRNPGNAAKATPGPRSSPPSLPDMPVDGPDDLVPMSGLFPLT